MSKLSLAYKLSKKHQKGRRKLRHLEIARVNTAFDKSLQPLHQAKFANRQRTVVAATELALGS